MKTLTMRTLLSAAAFGLGAGCMATQVQPPKLPHIDQPLTEAQIAKLPKREQPAALKGALTDLSVGSIKEREAKLKKFVLAHLVFVKGGSFQMGDFGPIWLTSELPLTDHKDDKVLHKVTLSSYSIEAYKTTYAAFDVYSDATHSTRAGMDDANDQGAHRNPYVPAGVYWPQADGYCRFLHKLTGLPFALPTEAQWEYAARSRGQFFAFSTNDGNIDSGENIADPGYADKLVSESPSSDTFRLYQYAVGIFPPSPLHLYDMGVNGYEWTRDYYDAHYYSHSPEHDPVGPSTGDRRVVRGYDLSSNFYGGITVLRHGENPMLIGKNLLTGKVESLWSSSYGVRCVVDQVIAMSNSFDQAIRAPSLLPEPAPALSAL